MSVEHARLIGKMEATILLAVKYIEDDHIRNYILTKIQEQKEDWNNIYKNEIEYQNTKTSI